MQSDTFESNIMDRMYTMGEKVSGLHQKVESLAEDNRKMRADMNGGYQRLSDKIDRLADIVEKQQDEVDQQSPDILLGKIAKWGLMIAIGTAIGIIVTRFMK